MDRLIKNDSSTPVNIQCGSVKLDGDLSVPDSSVGIVLFVHGSGSSRNSPRNRFVAAALNQRGIATLLFDLLTRKEEEIDERIGHLRFDISLLSERLIHATEWLLTNDAVAGMNFGYFGASTGAAAALVAASVLSDRVKAVVSRGGRPDLAGSSLSAVKCPTLLLVGGYDGLVIDLNKEAMKQLKSIKKMIVIPEATHLFEESGKLELVAHYAGDWFLKYLGEKNDIQR